MLNRWRDEIDAGAQMARSLSDQMFALVQRVLVIGLTVGLAAGLVIGGFLVWLTK